MTWTRPLVLAALLMCCASSVSAQTDGTIAVGMSVSARPGPSAESSGQINPALLWRFGHGDEGWGWKWGFNWYSTQLEREVGSAVTDFGELHVRPFMAGYGYTHRVGRRTAITASMLGGYAFTSFQMLPSFDDAYRRTLGAGTVDTSASNAFVLKPEVSTWVDLSRKVGLNFSVGYMLARPEVSLSSSLGVEKRRTNADVFMIKIGAVYSVY
jgi:hypothetical protein